DENAPNAFMRVGDSLGDEQSIAGIENHINNQGVERVADQTRCATLNEIHMFGCRGAARFNSQSPQQDCCAEKFDYAVDAKCLKQQTLRRPAEQERCSSFEIGRASCRERTVEW